MKWFLFFLLQLGVITNIQAQDSTNFIKKIIKKTFSSQGDTTRKGSFFILPAFAYAQETGAEFGIAGSYNLYLNKKDQEIRSSNISLISTVTSKKQKKINVNADLWTSDNDYHIILELRARDWPFNFYGIGNDTWKLDEDNIEQTLYRFKADIEKKILPDFYIGINTSFDHYKFNDINADGIFQQNNVLGKSGGKYATLGASALYDSRDVTTYANKGNYIRVKYAYTPKSLNSNHTSASFIELDIRDYHEIFKNLNLASQIVYRETLGSNTPFYTMRDLGGDMTMRGYYLGRYRDKKYLTAQIESRYRFHPRLGVVGFLGTGSAYSKENKPRFVPSYGLGGRYFFSIEHGSSIRIDYAFGEKRPGEARQSGFYLSLSEAF